MNSLQQIENDRLKEMQKRICAIPIDLWNADGTTERNGVKIQVKIQYMYYGQDKISMEIDGYNLPYDETIRRDLLHLNDIIEIKSSELKNLKQKLKFEKIQSAF